MSVHSNISKLFKTYNELSVKEIVDKLSVSKQMVHLALNKMLEAGELEKLGRTPKTIYRVIKKTDKVSDNESEYRTAQSEKEFLKNNFVVVSANGNLLEGEKAFEYWCQQRKLPFAKTLNEFIDTKKKYAIYYEKSGMVDGSAKLKATYASTLRQAQRPASSAAGASRASAAGYEKINLHKLFYLDFYAIERFGKTRLGTILHYAKQGQNRFLMKLMMTEINKRIKDFIKNQKADAIAFVSPSIRREVQIMKFIQADLNFSLPIVEIKKLSGIIPVPQKSLSKLEERIANAENTFSVTDQRKFKHVVLIDDAVGSGATLNQIAGKILNKQVAKKVTGLAIVGSFKGFDVITDV